ncbi:hypothetical protein [Streptomyces diastatochromogenes]|nr:hypothetical protein [Streptomyces diastatochromogenes]
MIANVPHAGTFGRETVTSVRTFDQPGRSRPFDPRTVIDPVREEARA